MLSSVIASLLKCTRYIIKSISQGLTVTRCSYAIKNAAHFVERLSNVSFLGTYSEMKIRHTIWGAFSRNIKPLFLQEKYY